MATDPYASCPCGSGKKFKWCCQEIHGEIDRAYDQLNSGQHEAALQTVARAVAQHPESAEAWGRQAHILMLNDRLEEAEQSLDRAFAVNPTYPFGFLLRGLFRQAEGEVIGSLMLFRKSAEAFAADAHDQLTYLNELIADTELQLNKPVAARAAIRRAMAHNPGNDQTREAIDAIFGPNGRLPAVARKDYALRAPANAGPEWGPALERGASGRLTDALKVLQAWADKHPNDSAALYNLGLVRAWLGDNGPAVEALGKSVDLEADEERATESWALAEVLRCGHGMDSVADHVEHRVGFPMRDPQAVVNYLQHLEQAHRLIGVRSNPQAGMVMGLILDEVPTIVLSGAAAPPARLAAHVMITGPTLQFWHPKMDSVEKVVAEAMRTLGPALGDPSREKGPCQFGDVVAEALLFPVQETTQFDADAKIRTNAQHYFEELWVNQPLRALLGKSPLEATSDPILRKRLRGIVLFLHDCAAVGPIRLYDFDRLLARLGLGEVKGEVAVAAAAPTEEPAVVDIEAAFRTAHRAGDDEVATKHAHELVARPPAGDRYSVYAYLAQQAQRTGDFDAALGHIDAGEKYDCESNEGRRRNDYELQRAKLLARKKDSAAAKDVFERLLGRVPADLDVAGTAAEAMLSLKDSAAALHFAEHGLSQARSQGNRDQEGRFHELIGAAKR
ncbi:MAG: tetratricopeptide repeat protein [Gemmataceae bacterium]